MLSESNKRIAIARIDVADERFQFRFKMDAGGLRESIAENGQLIPVTLWRPQKGSRYLVVDGFRRLDALIALGYEDVVAIVVRCTEDEAFARAYLENVVRKNLTPLEKATGICAVIDRIGVSRAAEQMQLSTKQIRRYVHLMEAPSLTKQALKKEKITMAHALIISEYLPHIESKEEELIMLAELNSAAELRKLLKKKRNSGRPKKYLRIDDDVLRVYPFKFNRGTASKTDRRRVQKALRSALDFIDG